MLVAIVSVIIMLSMLDRAVRLGRLDLCRIRTKHKLLALRDTLQNAASTGAVGPGSRLYNFCSRIIEGLSSHLEDFNLYGMIAASFFAKPTPALEEIRESLERPENSRYQSILSGFHKCIMEFHEEQHCIAVPFLRWLGRLVPDQSNTLREELKSREVTAVLSNPKISNHGKHQLC